MSQDRRPLIAGNWKINVLKADGLSLAGTLAQNMKGQSDAVFDMVVCPSFTLLTEVGNAIADSAIALGAQNCHAQEKGAHTGDVSPTMLEEMGCQYVIVGHSERRADHGETNGGVKAKAAALQALGLTAIICIGETEEEFDAGQTLEVIKTQLTGSLPGDSKTANTVIAYEPVWAIGTGRTPTLEEVQDVHALIRGELTKALGEEPANGIRVLYGGSMSPENARDLLALADVDGGLIGTSSLKAEDFWAIAQSCV